MHRLLTFACGRRAKFLVVPVFVLLALALGSLQPQLQERSENASAESWLPAGSESREAYERIAELRDADEGVPAIVVIATRSGEPLSDAQLSAIDRYASSVRSASTADARLAPIREVLSPADPLAAMRGQRSEDGSTATVVVPVSETAQPRVQPVVHHLRDQLDELPDSLRAHVTGPAALGTDAGEIFEAIDVTLLTATIVLVLVLLLAIYRSPLIALVPIVTVALTYMVAAGLSYVLVEATGMAINMQTTAILIVLMFGAGTDYCLLIVGRFREELRRHADTHAAMRETVRHTTPAILASGGTVVAAMLVLLLAQSDPMRTMGPVLALGILLMMVSGLTLLPAILTILGRRSFWPVIPAYDPEHAGRRSNAALAAAAEEPGFRVWGRIARFVMARPRSALAVPVAVLALFTASGMTASLPHIGWGSSDAFLVTTDSGEGVHLLSAAFPAGELAPGMVLVEGRSSDAALAAAEDVAAVLGSRDDVQRVSPPQQIGEAAAIVDVVLSDDPFAEETFARVPELRADLQEITDRHDVTAKLGGPTAQAFDTTEAAERDERVIAPVALVLVFAMLVLLLRAVVAPLHIMASVVLSFMATLGLSLFLFDHVFGHAGATGGFALFVFIFVVGLGVDYNIFLVSRIREETGRLGDTRAGTRAGLQYTGGIITSAGLILAGTFAVLAALPALMLFQLGVAVALGVLIDTFIVRTFLVPAAMALLAERNWWPGGSPGGGTDTSTGDGGQLERDSAPGGEEPALVGAGAPRE